MQHRSHLLHAIEGLDRYPRYISRWKETDINSLEQALKEKLEQVREQKNKHFQPTQIYPIRSSRILSRIPRMDRFLQTTNVLG